MRAKPRDPCLLRGWAGGAALCGTRREYVHVGLSAPSMAQTVPQRAAPPALPNYAVMSGLTGLCAHGAILQQAAQTYSRSEEHTSELQSRENLVCRLLLE